VLFEARAYLRHFVHAKGPHGVHSPYVFDLITKVLTQHKTFYVFDKIEKERNFLLHDQRVIVVEDFGAGSRVMNNNERRVADIAKHALQPAQHAQAIFRLAEHHKPKMILELGTCFGITSSYLAATSNETVVHTIEGSSTICDIARVVFQHLKISNVYLHQGKFHDKLPDVLTAMKHLDFVLMDGHHAYEPTISYFNSILPFLHEDSIVVVDDIYWSADMQKAWMELSRRPEITLSLDFFHFGVLYFKKNRVTEHFKLRLP
jgi:predicted O-methyltransferase YrrM